MASPDLSRSLSAALRGLGRLALDGGLLAQVWIPSGEDVLLRPEDSKEDASPKDGEGLVLRTKGLPYSILGPGDMLAIFRCLSCKYSFSADPSKQDTMGAPGRVYVSGEVETSDNVQNYENSIYLRAKDAQACRVTSTLLLPVYTSPVRSKAAAVLEVTQFVSSGITYNQVFDWASEAMEAVDLYTPIKIQTKTFEMQSHALSIRFFSSRNSALGKIFGVQPSDDIWQHTNLSSKMMRPSDLHAQELESSRNKPSPMHGATAQGSRPIQQGSDDEDASQTPSPKTLGLDTADVKISPVSKALLTKEDLEKHFDLGLKEAARRLGVCNTTLKRACRRYGIMKWPRRDLLKAAKKQQSPSQESYAPRQSDLVGSEAMIMVTPDTDASPIGNFGPGLHQSSSQAPNSPLFGERSSGSYLEPMRIDPDYTIPLPGNSGTRLAFPGGSACSSLEAQKSTDSPHAARELPRDPIRIGLQQRRFLAANMPQKDLQQNFRGFLETSQGAEQRPADTPTDARSGRSAMPEESSSLAQTNPAQGPIMPAELSNTDRLESFGLGDAMTILGSIGTELHDFTNFLSTNPMDWSNDFPDPAYKPG